MKRYNEVGITSITERSSNADGFRDYQQLKAQGRLPLRVRVTIRIGTGDNSEAAHRAHHHRPCREVRPGRRLGPRRTAEDRHRRRGALRHGGHARAVPGDVARAVRHHRSQVQRRVRPRPGSDRRRRQELRARGQPAGLAAVVARDGRSRRGHRARCHRGGEQREVDARQAVQPHPRLLRVGRHGQARREPRRGGRHAADVVLQGRRRAARRRSAPST